MSRAQRGSSLGRISVLFIVVGLERAGGHRRASVLMGGGWLSIFTYLLELKLSTASNVGIGIECGSDAASNGCGIHLAVCPSLEGVVLSCDGSYRGGDRAEKGDLKFWGYSASNGGAQSKYEGTLVQGGKRSPEVEGLLPLLPCNGLAQVLGKRYLILLVLFALTMNP